MQSGSSVYQPIEDPDTRITCDGGPYHDSWTALLKIAKCLAFPADGTTVARLYAPILNSDLSQVCGGTIRPNFVITEKAQDEDPTYNDIDGMPWFWHWRDKPLSSTNVLPLGFIPAGTLQYP